MNPRQFWKCVVLLSGFVCSQVLAQKPSVGIDFGAAHLTLGMTRSLAISRIEADRLYTVVEMRGSHDGLSFGIRRSDGGDQGAIMFDEHYKLKQAVRSWTSPETFFDAVLIVRNILFHLRAEGLATCLVAPLEKSYMPDQADSNKILIDCGRKSVEISAFAYDYEGRRVQQVDITETLLAMPSIVRRSTVK